MVMRGGLSQELQRYAMRKRRSSREKFGDGRRQQKSESGPVVRLQLFVSAMGAQAHQSIYKSKCSLVGSKCLLQQRYP